MSFVQKNSGKLYAKIFLAKFAKVYLFNSMFIQSKCETVLKMCTNEIQ